MLDVASWWGAQYWPTKEEYVESIRPLVERGEPLPDLPSEYALKAIEEAAKDGLRLDLGNFASLGSLAGRNNRPRLLLTAWRLGVIDETVVRASVGPVWCMAEFPDRSLPWSSWKEMFNVAGYTRDGKPAERPTEWLQLYRAAPIDHRHGHSWTEDLEVARSFLVNNHRVRLNPVLWTARVNPNQLLARLEEDRSGEPSYVVDTKRLRVVRAD